MKKRYLILGMSILGIIAIVIFLLLNNKNLFLKEDTILDNIPVSSDEEIIDITNEMISDKDSSNIESESITETEDNTKQIQTSNKKQEIIVSTEEKSNVKNKDKKQSKESSSSKATDTKVSNTKEETSTAKVAPKQETSSGNTNNNANSNTQSNTTFKEKITDNTPVDTIKRISAEELKTEKLKYLKDIQSINSNLQYKELKRGQVFWPYRTSEIEFAIGSVTFGTVYYYVDVFVEGNQEKFKYYIDWTGEQ